MKQQIKEVRLKTDVLVIGSGIAGMFAAIKAKEAGLDVILTDKGYVGRCGGSHYAEGDIIFFRRSRGHIMKDWLDKVSRDTEYLNNRDWNEIVYNESEQVYDDLERWGVPFYKVNGELQFDGPHGIQPIPKMYEVVSMQSREYQPAMRKYAQTIGVRVMDRIFGAELLKQDGRVVGAVGFHTTSGKVYVIQAKSVIICTGAGATYKSRAMNTDYWTGDGPCMAFRAGAEVEGYEFRHTNTPPGRQQVIDRKKIYDGSPEIDDKILDLASKYPHCTLPTGWFFPTGNSANEPVVWYGGGDIHAGKGPLFFDLSNWTDMVRKHHEKFFVRVGKLEFNLLGLDMFNGGQLIYPSARQELCTPIGGAGIWPIDKMCRSTVPGLYAAGGSCATMMSGAKYGGMGLGLTGGAVTGSHAAAASAEDIAKLEDIELDEEMVARTVDIVTRPAKRQYGHGADWMTHIIENAMVPYYVLIYKKKERLEATYTMIKFMDDELLPNVYAKDPHDWRMAYEAKNMLLNAQLNLKASLERKESRSSHFREDYPYRDDKNWLCWLICHKDENGEMVFRKEELPDRLKVMLDVPYEKRYIAEMPLEKDLLPKLKEEGKVK